MPIEQVTTDYVVKVRAGLFDAASMLDELTARGDLGPMVRLVIGAIRVAVVEGLNALGDVLTDAPPAPARRGKPDARANRDHRHRFKATSNGVQICEVCGKEKGAGGRPRAAAADEAPPPDTRTAPLPFKPNPEAADRHADGGLGSSGMRR